MCMPRVVCCAKSDSLAPFHPANHYHTTTTTTLFSSLPFPSLFLSTPFPAPIPLLSARHSSLSSRFILIQSPLVPFFLASSRFLFFWLHTTYLHTHPPALGLEASEV
ncbi:hypothetical protein GGP41_008043 [Bipolaris sorokiniana]|uniref:Uncharacterized protein n=1 Tax=Cochliobolus sativus TaxID=45130 RepID=A0A8H5ZLT2_COCSA|nr:hypothetical protein GGP41_008043 [Bipolaris sorokiniana]